ncbi:MAG: hypothetical protein KDA69_13425 [Planctomycetaceae bacterium]|nr:hypothetical protein [Planctomycetaceae bacterium]
MELEFDCPYCTSAVRVSAEFAGKIGRCPKCDTRLRIPDLPDSGQSPTANPDVPPLETIGDEVLVPQQVAAPSVSAPPSAAPAQPQGGWAPNYDPNSPVEKLRKKKRQGSPLMALVPPLLFGGIFLLVGGIYWYWSLPSYKGELEGTVIDSGYALSVTLDGASSGAPREEFHSWTRRLFQNPVMLNDNEKLLGIRYLSKDGQHLTVLLEPGAKTELVQVPITAVKAVAKYYDEHESQMLEARNEELAEALTDVALAWVEVAETTQHLDNLGNFTERLAYNAHVQGLGHVCEAVIGSEIYPCVGEDSQQHLIFLVPKGTNYFVVRERTETRVFPARLKVEVKVVRPFDEQQTQQLVKPEPETLPESEPEMTEPASENSEETSTSENQPN